MFKLEFRENRKQILSWAMYDWANQAFATSVLAGILPIYYSLVAASNLEPHVATIYWSYTITIALVIIALLAPVFGAISDYSNKKKFFLKICTFFGVLFTALLYFINTGDWLYASFVFILANIGFSLAEIFYNSLLKFIAGPKDADKVSAFGYAVGYLGGGLLLGINLLMFHFMEDSKLAAKLSFLSVSVWWAFFSIPLFRNVEEPVTNQQFENINYVIIGFSRMYRTFKEISKYRQVFLFLIAFWIYNDGIGTIIKLAIIYGTELGISPTSLLGALLVTQIIGIPFTMMFGRISGSIGTKNSIYIGLVVYAFISVLAFFITTALHFWILALLVGTVQGGTQALSRSYFSSMVPEEKAAEFFGFYGMSSKFAGIAGPLTFAFVAQLTGSSRLSILSIIIFFIAGIIVLSFVKEDEAAGTLKS